MLHLYCYCYYLSVEDFVNEKVFFRRPVNNINNHKSCAHTEIEQTT